MARPPLHPQMREVVEQLAGPLLWEMSPGAARAVHRERFQRLNQDAVAMARVEDLFPTGPGGPVPLRVLVPGTAARPAPAMLYFHGGGWVLGSHETVEPQCRYLANATGAVVISVEYRVAPEHRFPAAYDDCVWATGWVRDNAAALGIDPARIAVSGDSAGGGLAAGVAQAAKAGTAPMPVHQLLLFPVADMAFDTPSYSENRDGPFLTRPMMEWFRDLYLNDPAERLDPRVAPIRAGDLSGLAPATVVTASHDPLRDEGIAYARRLSASGVTVRHRNFEGYTHAFLSWGGYVDAAFEGLDFCAEGLRAAFA